MADKCDFKVILRAVIILASTRCERARSLYSVNGFQSFRNEGGRGHWTDLLQP